MVGCGKIRIRKDGIMEYTINKLSDIEEILVYLYPFLILKKKQAKLMLDIIKRKKKIKTEIDFKKLLKMIDSFRELNYSKKRKIRALTP